MPRRRPLVPPYELHKPSGQAYKSVDGRRKYLGLHGTPASREKRARIVRAAFADPPVAAEAKPAVEPDAVTVMMVLAGLWSPAKQHYSYEGKRPPGEIGND